MTTTAVLVTMEARSGKEAEVEEFLRGALPLVAEEPATVAWFALRLGPSTFGIFDAFPDDAGRDAHLAGKVAEALFARAEELFSAPPHVQKVDVLADKLPAEVASGDEAGWQAAEWRGHRAPGDEDVTDAVEGRAQRGWSGSEWVGDKQRHTSNSD